MPKKLLPTYSINTLTENRHGAMHFSADFFARYLDEHRNLQFPHKHSFYHLVYFSKGTGQHSIDFINFPVRAGQIYFMIPGQVHSWDFKQAPDGFIVNFSEQFINEMIVDPRYLDQYRFFNGVPADQVIDIPKKHRIAIEQTLVTIINEGKSSHLLNSDFARFTLLQLLIQVHRLLPPEQREVTQYNSLLFRNFQKLVDQHYREKKLTKDYAALLYVTPNHLNALSKDVSGRSAGEVIRDRVLLEAKRLLINAKMNITEIAGELGFSDNSYFSKFFRKYEGISPEIFRHQTIKNK